ncbi:neurochondrin [Biomphalaria pfeifferi]|uniref:Neurochondrin n=1 Tax=Biomphalaria pfeifferi TaxID=112525 RepID=A0AAD8BEN8_BIOPF|nr:neurochondrin [Biomphalaria pfeifferi]
MYAAHVKKSKIEESKSVLEKCVNDFRSAETDSERFSNILEIACHVRDSHFTEEDQRKVLEIVGISFLARLLNTSLYYDTSSETYPPNFYKMIALSVFSSLSIDPFVARQVEVKQFLQAVNSEIQQKNMKIEGSKNVYSDCEEIVANLSHDSVGISYLIECGTSEVLIDYVTSSQCHDPVPVLQCLSSICKNQGDSIFSNRLDHFHNMISLIVDKIGQGSDLTSKVEYATILTAFLNGVSMIELSIDNDWVLKLVKILNKFISIKTSPDDSDAVLFLVCALVSAVGPEVLKPQLVGGSSLVKAVVARVFVEVYMLLDCINSDNVLERYYKLDKVYKLLSDLVHYLAEFGEDTDPYSIIVIYKKLVEISETIMEFLSQVWNEVIGLPKNHVVVLISVRALAAMLSEITEDPTEQLLDLIPFFDFLCQNVEYSEDVVMEVKSATQAALENIRLLGIQDSQDGDIEIQGSHDLDPGGYPSLPPSFIKDSTSPEGNIQQKNKQFAHNSHSYCSNNHTDIDKQETQQSSSHVMGNETPERTDTIQNSESSSCRQLPHPDISSQSQTYSIHLTSVDFHKFEDYREAVCQLRSQPSPSISRKVTFIKKSSFQSAGESDSVTQIPFWQSMPDDVLGYLIPFYGFLMDSQAALEIMVKNNCFSTLVSYIEKSLSSLLENKSSSQPENITVNALSLVEQVYTYAPVTAADLKCFQSLFELSVLSLPNLLSLPHPPPLVSLKLIEASLTSYRIQMRGSKRNPSLQRLKHSKTRLFKAVVDYLSTFYTFRPSRRRPLMIFITGEFRDIWILGEEVWCGCIAGLSVLLRSVEELQEVLLKSIVLPDFLDFLKDFEVEDLKEFPSEVSKLVEFMISLIEAAAESCAPLRSLILQYNGLAVAKQLNFKKLQRILTIS